jgi:xylan 1,4-beta-xylosidase
MDEAAVTTPAPDARPVQPLFDGDMSDVYVLPRPDAWYLTDTTPGQGIQLWLSTDQKRWTKVGKLWPDEAVAPQIHHIRGQFYLVYGKPSGGIELLAAKKAAGPYRLVSHLTTTGSDPGLFEDTDGIVYLYSGDGQLVPFTADLSAVSGTARKIVPGKSRTDANGEFNIPFTFKRDPPVTDRVGKRGFFVTKIGGQYAFFANETTGRMGIPTDDVYYVTAPTLNGPYSERNLVIPHGGQTCVFETGGKVWATFYGNDPGAALLHKPALINLISSPLKLLQPAPSVILEKGVTGKTNALLGTERMRDPSVTLGGDGNYYSVPKLDHNISSLPVLVR